MCNVILKYFALAWRTEIHSYTKKIIHGKYQKKKIWLFEKNFLRRVKKEYLVEEGIGKLYSSKWLIKSWKSKHLYGDEQKGINAGQKRNALQQEEMSCSGIINARAAMWWRFLIKETEFLHYMTTLICLQILKERRFLLIT